MFYGADDGFMMELYEVDKSTKGEFCLLPVAPKMKLFIYLFVIVLATRIYYLYYVMKAKYYLILLLLFFKAFFLNTGPNYVTLDDLKFTIEQVGFKLTETNLPAQFHTMFLRVLKLYRVSYIIKMTITLGPSNSVPIYFYTRG